MAKVVNSELDAFLALIVASSPLASGTSIHLFKNNVVFDSTTTLGGLTEADYTSYAPVAVSGWTTPSGGSGGTSSSATGTANFSPGVLGTPQDCYGWYMLDFTGALVAGDNFAGGPLNMGGTIVNLAITVSLTGSPA